MVAVPYPLGCPGDSPADRFLSQRGWSIRPGPAVMMTAHTSGVARTAPAGQVDLCPEPDQAWLDLYHYRGQKLPPIARQLLLSASVQVFASIRRGGSTLAIGRVAVADGWGGLTAVEVHPGHRRAGLATAITAPWPPGPRATVPPASISRWKRPTSQPVRCTPAPDSPTTTATTTASHHPPLTPQVTPSGDAPAARWPASAITATRVSTITATRVPHQ
jgi:hypothetical protein